MKNIKKYGRFWSYCWTIVLCLLPLLANAQAKNVQGIVVDEKREPLTGCSVKISGTTFGTVTDLNGKFEITLPEGNSLLEFSFLGYKPQIVSVDDNNRITVQLQPDEKLINEVVVIGYGTQRKKDLTGSVAVVTDKDFNNGLINSPEQLINGKIAGLQVMSNNGSPTSGSSIRIRGGASLNASNEPLIVLDGVPLEIGGISGNDNNFLSLINPNDIESMTVLKDASSTAIYGSRASNGVLLITTKKGSGERLKINFTTTNSIQTRTQSADMLSENQFRDVIQSQGSNLQKSLIGNASTDWNDEIFQSAFGTDNNLSLSGKIAEQLPFRASLGAYKQDGILKTDQVNRYTGNLSISPSFFKDYLKFNLNVKAAMNNNRFADGAAVWNAATYNPTIPVYSGSSEYGGYNEATNGGNLVTRAVLNPLGILEERNSTSTVGRIIGNLDADYQMRFLPDLRAHVTLGYDYAQGEGKVYVPAEAAYAYSSGGRDYRYGPQKKENRLFTAYLNYNHLFPDIKSAFDATAGYDYQFWKSTAPTYEELNIAGEAQSTSAASDQRHLLLSLYARLNYSYDSRYLLTATVRRDGTSRFSKNNRWGTFPSLAFAWRLTEETFLKNNGMLSDLKLRLSYGATGQQDGIGNYGYLPVYTYGQDGAQYLFGNQYYYTYRPEAYNSDLKWESTTAYNAGIDFAFLNGRIAGSLDYYARKTKDLLAIVPTPAGTNFDKTIMTNVGNVDSDGWEFALNATLLNTRNITWSVAFNTTLQKVKIDNLSLIEGTEIVSTPVGPTIDNTYIQVFTEGYAPYMFYVYKQLYDEKTGKPIEGAYANLDNNAEINSDDLYHYHSPAPDVMFGLSTQFQYKKWSLGMGFRANVGNYVYNGMAMNTGAFGTVSYNDFQLNNLNKSYLKTGFQSRQYLSDYYVENASFLKMDNLALGYDFGEIIRNTRLNLSVMVQNVFTWTKYSGVDPEVPSGFDSTFYPRPRIFSLSLGLEF
ncbi:MAG: TonB-dependent receptor [Dysgonamonadaceae bacterium]|jgi:iron complex outermembrane receptor protein|nr:TonB-dependent receptor [Dysgonamonadaceae bacterium]